MRRGLLVCMLCATALGAAATASEACPPRGGDEVAVDLVTLQQALPAAGDREAFDQVHGAVAVEVHDQVDDHADSDPQAAPRAASGTVVAALAFLAIALGAIVVIAGPACDAQRSRRRRRRTTTPIDARLVTRLAAVTRARALATALVSLATACVVVETMEDPAPHLFLLVAPLILLVRASAMLARAQLVLRIARDPRLTTRYDGSRFIFVLAGDELLTWLVAWPSTLQRELRRGIPTATAKPRGAIDSAS